MSNELTKKEAQHGMFLPQSTEIFDIGGAVLKVSIPMLNEALQKAKELEAEISEKRRKYLYWQNLFNNVEEQAKFLGNIENNGKALVDKRALLPKVPLTILEKDVGSVSKEIASLLVWLDAQFNSYAPLSKEQILTLSQIIYKDFGNFWIEDIAQCFRDKLKSKEVFKQIDTSIILGWITEYDECEKKKGFLENQNKHLATK